MFAALAKLPGGHEAIARIIGYLGEAAGARSADVEQMSNTIAEHAPGAKEAVMNSVERLREEGRIQGEQAALQRLLQRKFGELSEAQTAIVRAAKGETLDRLLDRAIAAASIEAVFAPDAE